MDEIDPLVGNLNLAREILTGLHLEESRTAMVHTARAYGIMAVLGGAEILPIFSLDKDIQGGYLYGVSAATKILAKGRTVLPGKGVNVG